jgi:hypothetical protein
MRIDPALAAHVAVAVRAHCRQLERDGFTPPPGLAVLADQLMTPERDAVTRRRALSKARSRRYRARKGAAGGCGLAAAG